jgi:hypothetical protein
VEGDRLPRALAAIDAANAGDPNSVDVRGAKRPKELAHAELVSEWVERLAPEAGEALRLAARAHHVRRWEIPRADFPPGRVGYHRWRSALHDHHARIAGEILARVGYDGATIHRVQDLVRKRGLGRDPEVQALEDALCLVFLETQLGGFSLRTEEAKLVGVLRKTLRKMSPAARAHALLLSLGSRERALLSRAAQEEAGGPA